MIKKYIIKKHLEIKTKNFLLISAPHFSTTYSNEEENFDVAETEDISFLPVSSRTPKNRQGFIVESSPIENETEIFDKKNIINPIDIDIISAYVISDKFLVKYRKLGFKKINIGILDLYEKSLKNLPQLKDSILLEITSDGFSKASALFVDNLRYRVINYNYIIDKDTFIPYEIFSSDRKKSKVYNIGYVNGELIFSLRKNYRSKEISTFKTSKEKFFENVYVNSVFDYSVLYGKSSDEKKNLHLNLNCFRNNYFDEFDFLQNKNFELMKIERDFSGIFYKKDIENIKNQIMKAVKNYVFSKDKKIYSISISSILAAGLPVFELAYDIESELGIKVDGVIFKDVPFNLICHKYTSNGDEIPNLSDYELWLSSPMSKADVFDIPTLIIAEKNRNDIWYGNSIAMYSSLKYFSKDTRCILTDENLMKSDNIKNEIINWLNSKILRKRVKNEKY